MKTLLQFDSENGFATLTPVAYGTQLIAFMMTLQVGFVKWIDDQPVARVMGRIGDGFKRPSRRYLDELERGAWSGGGCDPRRYTYLVELCELENPNVRLSFEFSCSPEASPFGPLCVAYAEHRRTKADDLPVVELGRGPTFKIIDWVNPHFIIGGLAKNVVTFPLRKGDR